MTSTLFRVENPNTNQGLWYRKDGSWNPHIFTLTEGVARDIPMGFNPEFKVEGLEWYSACDDLKKMEQWFSFQDLVELGQQGYGLYAIEVSRYRDVYGHAAFAAEHVLSQTLIDIDILKGS